MNIIDDMNPMKDTPTLCIFADGAIEKNSPSNVRCAIKPLLERSLARLLK